jgi:hypothetical protein
MKRKFTITVAEEGIIIGGFDVEYTPEDILTAKVDEDCSSKIVVFIEMELREGFINTINEHDKEGAKE